MTDQSRVLAVCDMLVQPATALDEARVVESAAEQLARLIPSDRALVVAEGPEGMYVGAYPGKPDRVAGTALLQLVGSVDAARLVRGHDLSPFFGEANDAMAATFTASDRYRGAVVVVEPLHGQFSALDEWLLLVAARRTAAHFDLVALHHERLADAQIVEDTRLAGELQLTMLPIPLPQGSAVDVAGRLRPARFVAGDLYDWQAGDAATTAVLADVSGKGAAAALIMAKLHSAVRRNLKSCGPDPSAVVTGVQRELAPVLDRAKRIATIVVAAIDPLERTVRVASAGHSPTILRRAGSGQLIHPSSPPLGVGEFPTRDVTRSFDVGDALVLASDGLVDQRSPKGSFYGIDRLLGQVADSSTPTAAALADKLMANVSSFASGEPQDDDQTVVAMQLGVDSA